MADVFLAARAAAMPYLPDLHAPEETRAWIRDVVLRGQDVHVAEVDGAVGGFLALGAANEEREPDALYEWRPLSPARPGRPSRGAP